MSYTVAFSFSYFRLRLLVCSTAEFFSSQTRFNSPSGSYFSPNISTFSGNLLLRTLLFSDITDLICWVYYYDSYFLIILLSSDAIALICLCRWCTLETAMLFSEYMIFASTCKSAALLLISFSSSVRRDIYCLWWSFASLRILELTWLVFFSSKGFYMDDTVLYLSTTTRSSYPSSTTFASFAWHRVISIFSKTINAPLKLILGSFCLLRIFPSLRELLVIGCYWCLICTYLFRSFL